MNRVAVIPVKQLEKVKQRLSGLLTAKERKALFSCMVEDVLTAVEATEEIDRIMVVTDDAAVAYLAGAYGAGVLPEAATGGLTGAVTKAGELLASEGVGTMLVLHGDLPLITPVELEVVLEGFGLCAAPEFLIVPAADLGGSNCVACSPPDCMVFGFGPDSFRRHLGFARERGIDPSVARLPGIGLDIDTPEDLNRFLEVATRDTRDCHTLRYLVDAGIIHKLNHKLADIG